MTLIIKIKHIVIITLLIFGVNYINAQEMSVPIDVQIEIIPKILSLNKSFNLEDSRTVIKIGILYSSELRTSKKIKEKFK